MAQFAYSMTKADVTAYWRDFEARQVAKRAARATISKESPMVQKSLSDLAWEAFSAAARALVTAKTYRTYGEAVDAMKAASHPAYLTYLASLSGGSTPPAPGDVTKAAAAVVKQSEETHFAKRRQVQAEVQKRVTALVRTSGATEQEAVAAVFKADPQLYEDWRTSGYAKGPGVPPPPPDVATVTTGPVYDQVQKMALAMRQDDPWGQYVGKSENEMVKKVFDTHPELFTAYRNESYNRG